MKKKIGDKVIASLTTQELAEVLDALFTFLNSGQIEKILSDINTDTASVILELLNPKNEVTQPVISQNKLYEEWRTLWEKWDDIVSDLGDEYGKYIFQEDRWDEPSFDSDRFADDLDAVAEEMVPMLAQIWEMRIEKDSIFEEALSVIEDWMKTYPEWINEQEVGCFLDTAVTECVLQWTWLISDGNPEIFLGRLITLENDLEFFSLSKDAYENFFADRTDEENKSIYQYIKTHENDSIWKDRLGRIHSIWHHIYYEYSKTVEPENCLRLSYNLLDQNWQYGIPLIKDKLEKNNLTQAEELYEKTLNSFAGKNRDGEVWKPENTLLVSWKYGGSSPNETISGLLGEWGSVCEQIGLQSKATLLKFQQAAYQSPYDWNKLCSLIQKLNSPEISHLIGQWKAYNINSSLNSIGIRTDDQAISSNWINWLMDATLDATQGKTYFVEKTGTWIKTVSQKNKLSSMDQQLVNIFTCDLSHISDFKLRYPSLLKLINECRYGRHTDSSRRDCLKQMDGANFISDITELWVKHISDIMPDPGQVQGGKYESHALWLAALREIDPMTFQKVMTKWKVDYKRRKNLWTEIQ
ncbi:MAG: hypothetical protein HQK77_08435, partial [Desulfobacterales bacterium]|nr:hypothetical protein [Desulfobacterales bacterium]